MDTLPLVSAPCARSRSLFGLLVTVTGEDLLALLSVAFEQQRNIIQAQRSRMDRCPACPVWAWQGFAVAMFLVFGVWVPEVPKQTKWKTTSLRRFVQFCVCGVEGCEEITVT